MKVSDLGEFGLIGLIRDTIEKNSSVSTDAFRDIVIGIGDDAAVWKCESPAHVATTDCMVEDIHFDLDIITWEELGHKALAVNLSDVAAMGSVPKYALVSLSVPGKTESGDIEQLYRGMVGLANQTGVYIIGGNVSSSNQVIITIAVFGLLKSPVAMTRSGARVGDQIVVTGYIGLSAAGLKMLHHSLKFTHDTTRLFREAHNKPVPRVTEGPTLLLYDVRAAIDISDGLMADLQHLCEASKVGAVINQDKLPVHPLIKKNFSREYIDMALGGGEDYELLFTTNGQIVERLRTSLSCPVTVIGEIVAGKPEIAVVDSKGNPVSVESRGWDHFKAK
jgi:thiamine-monophosphate kinase